MATEEMIGRLVSLNVIEVNNGNYDYAKLRLAKTVAAKSSPILILIGKPTFSTKASIEYLNTVILFFVNYVQKRNKKNILKDKEISNILYALYCLDQQIPDVEV